MTSPDEGGLQGRGEIGLAPRVHEVDMLRGFALFGILLVNAPMIAGTYAGEVGGAGGSGLDRGVVWLVTALVSTEFYLPFSFLFGYSFVLQERAARRAGTAFASLHLRRTLALFALGVAHAVLLFPGDILMTYAVLGLVLYGLRGLGPRAALRIAGCLVVALAVLLLGYGLLVLAFTDPAVPATPRAPVSHVPPIVHAYRGGFRSVVGAHLGELPAHLGADLLYAPDILAAFLAGLAAAKAGLMERRGRDRAWLRRVVVRWLPVGLVGSVFTACCAEGPLDGRWFMVGQAVATLTSPALTAAYACALLLLLDTRGRAARLLAAAGRMSLTHYLTQSLVLACVFTGYGLGLYGRVGTALVSAGCVLLYAAQLALGARLMGRVRYGPVELLLRTVTLGTPPRTPAWTAVRPADDGVPPVR
ncbi:DUF418 domain-containing protein [Streptomyces pseudovenezuelae]|uniref:DUF418 domain-containing protein n=1 Tax=Streptomyces pseudovenezuelae TaxID=67350 RepID=A0ABT6LRP6_9ACTN|nr:DUF418 domain-containing protein [Streptomyces pseudovenezuelae]MDH6218464.1 uncharacterized protein [Streptomyces pseudovenezuelae]